MKYLQPNGGTEILQSPSQNQPLKIRLPENH